MLWWRSESAISDEIITPSEPPDGSASSVKNDAVRSDIASLPDPSERFMGREGAIRLLVLGGRQDDSALNEIVLNKLAQIPKIDRPLVIHEVGDRQLTIMHDSYKLADIEAHCVSHIDDMSSAYEWADLVICRPDVLTVAQLITAGVASILVSCPDEGYERQASNARHLSNVGGATLLPQAEFNAQGAALIQNLSRQQLQQMAANARKAADAVSL